MTSKINNKERAAVMKTKILFIAFLAIGSLLLAALNIQAQSASSTPNGSNSDKSSATNSNKSSDTVNWGGYDISSSIEIGVRGLDVNGFHDKYRSDFNYKPGLRIFDSSFLMEDKSGKQKGLDSLMITSSGWNADPTGFIRINAEKMGLYRFDSVVRQVKHYNNLNNHALGWHFTNTKHNFGDFDLTIFPQNEKFRLRLGSSFSRTNGTAGSSTRASGDEFPIISNPRLRSQDIRIGVDTKLAGFKMSFLYGFRKFKDETFYTVNSTQVGFNYPDDKLLFNNQRYYPTRGNTNYGVFTVQRSFAERLDFTGRFIYSLTDRTFNLTDINTTQGYAVRNAATSLIDNDIFNITGGARRPQSRGDLGVTYRVTDKFRISNSFSFDAFRITGDSDINDSIYFRSLAGVPQTLVFTRAVYFRYNNFRRFVNTIEGDYQFNRKFGINIGYRYTHREAIIEGYNLTLRSASASSATRIITNLPAATINNPNFLCPTTGVITSPNPVTICEEEENSTNTFLFGTRIKPTRNWSLFADVEHGESDNAFTRLSNHTFTNFRIRNNVKLNNQWAFNVSLITRDNENPSFSTSVVPGTTTPYPGGDLVANVKNRVFSAYVDWNPDPRFSLSTGYTYHHLTSETNVVVPLATLTPGFSQYFMREHSAFVDVSVQPIKRVSIFASYRFNKDTGQGDRVPTAPQFIVSSYPYQINVPEIRVAVRLTRNIDWNFGYQYYNYKENLANAYPPTTNPLFTSPVATGFPPFPFPPNQNYNAHMPYTSLRIHWGGSRDR